MIDFLHAIFRLAVSALIVVLSLWVLSGCASSKVVKPDQPSQDQPAKADKTFVDTFIQFFEPRD